MLGIVLWRTRWVRLGYALALGGTALLLATALLPIPKLVLAPLEDRFPFPQHLPDRVDGIIVLGGALDPIETVARGIPSLNDEAERMTTFVKLARLYPGAKKVFTGGNGLLEHTKIAEAGVARQLLNDLGLDTSQIVFEEKSRNTYENVLFSKELVHPASGGTWILITSAQHMPRAVGIFRRLGWPVLPYPVAYKSDQDYLGDFTGAWAAVDEGAREWLGLIAYRMLDRTDALFPGPDQRH